MGCYRCVVVVPQQTQYDPVGVCLRCGSMSCHRDGSRDLDYPQFICGICEIHRVSRSSGLPPDPGDPPPRGGGLPLGGDPVPPRDPFGGAGLYVDTPDFERRKPELAAQSEAHREEKCREIDEMINHLIELATDESARALTAKHLGDDFGTEEVHRTAVLLSNQLRAARDMQALRPSLLADAFGLATWVIGAEPGQEPTVAQLRHVPDRRLRVALGRSAINERA